MKTMKWILKYIVINMFTIYLVLKGVGLGFYLANKSSDEAGFVGLVIVGATVTVASVFTFFWNVIPMIKWLETEGSRWD